MNDKTATDCIRRFDPAYVRLPNGDIALHPQAFEMIIQQGKEQAEQIAKLQAELEEHRINCEDCTKGVDKIKEENQAQAEQIKKLKSDRDALASDNTAKKSVLDDMFEIDRKHKRVRQQQTTEIERLRRLYHGANDDFVRVSEENGRLKEEKEHYRNAFNDEAKICADRDAEIARLKEEKGKARSIIDDAMNIALWILEEEAATPQKGG